ncbi:hypothetical protein M3O39_06515 [Xanthomonas nasturtii]|uniref:hypothetical protein n=2 Tax=Xanthomonas nasturtii TaxID=1843581 RepID=UPI002011E34E|nr:hypothetical protein [Xanthomonas nasturtii]MCL1526239.1 hypothetical protein [Xanthomonas nasturtii]MCL1543773.1 hypothetical protein [Xanthomonas nasturtii]
MEASTQTVMPELGGIQRPVRMTSRVILAIIAFVVAQWLIVPGFLALDVPSHSDLWRYYVIAHEMSWKVAISSPRPLMLLALLALQGVHNAHALFTLLNVPAILFACLLMRSAEGLMRQTLLAWQAFVAFLVVFGTAAFYELNPLDYGGMLAGAILALQLGRLVRERDSSVVLGGWALVRMAAIVALLGYLSFETKPTFAALIPALPLILVRKYGYRKTLYICTACVVVIVVSTVKDIFLKSPFIQLGDASGPYKVGLNPLSFLKALVFYASQIVPVHLIPLALFGLWRAWCMDRRVFAGAIIAPILAVLPMCAIPDRLLPMYGWYGTIVLAAVLAPVFAGQRRGGTNWTIVLLTVLALGAGVAGIERNNIVPQWVKANHEFNTHAFAGLEALQRRVLPGERILVAGPLMPFSPFQSDDFIKLTSEVAFTWVVSFPASEAALVAMSNDSKVHVPFASLDYAAFDRVVIFDQRGDLIELEPATEFAAMTRHEAAARMYCHNELQLADNSSRLIAVMQCLSRQSETAAAESFGAQFAGVGNNNQWVWYERGKASEALGHTSMAYDAYQRAAALENAPVFRDAVKRVEPPNQ